MQTSTRDPLLAASEGAISPSEARDAAASPDRGAAALLNEILSGLAECEACVSETRALQSSATLSPVADRAAELAELLLHVPASFHSSVFREYIRKHHAVFYGDARQPRRASMCIQKIDIYTERSPAAPPVASSARTVGAAATAASRELPASPAALQPSRSGAPESPGPKYRFHFEVPTAASQSRRSSLQQLCKSLTAKSD